ncbi:MAG: hypothetical protein AVDCRST_MAG48-3854 [uncultured Friedmanniella sp.]|uniref:Uncharacterized protein n=1 Tax=uncultured Friedmanniella sp. TaxID=335381 RepID=A0A6J4LXE7_9ACTN|nr:MAG: hypothetical protein AVDCRST_MAG48-3854 [uncultured Friedmanniella sp.]
MKTISEAFSSTSTAASTASVRRCRRARSRLVMLWSTILVTGSGTASSSLIAECDAGMPRARWTLKE